MNKAEELSKNIKEATREAFKKALAEHGKDQLCGFALYTDESAMSLGATVNTDEHFKAVTKRRPKNKVSYQWSPPEWKEEGFEEEIFEEINDELYDYSEELGDNEKEFDEFTQAFFEECVKALEDLKPEIPADINENFVLVFDISDYEDTDRLVAWAKRLNGAEKTESFAELMKDF
ncbi:MAG TPA: DUF4303 domain-containing protein [Pyrinomonadaceae bacterium]|nr:DUF4303 domain-containing protein [Pyrinomonadaceae bacterium]